jgi:3'-5' exoribonuclease
MKAYVCDLAPDTIITSFFLVAEKELRSTREGKPYLRLELCDRSGSIEARLWENVDGFRARFERDDIIKVQARVENYKHRLQLTIERLRRAELAEVDVSDFFPHTDQDIEELYARLQQNAGAIKNPWLNRLVCGMIQDPAIAPRLKRAPAAKMMHHAFVGGLLEHIVSLCDLCRLAVQHYQELDLDLLLTGAILHDIGKLDELCYERSIHYTNDGQLLGHIILGLENVTGRMNAIEGFPPDSKTLVKHLLISHHGQYEFGSPKLPMFPEALVLHYLDDLDSKMAAARAVLGAEGGEAGWTVFSAALNRRLLRLEQFRAVSSEPAAAAAAESEIKAGTEIRLKTKIV